MKKLFAVCLVCLSILSVNAQKINFENVPVAVKSAFEKMYPSVKNQLCFKEDTLFKFTIHEQDYNGAVWFDSTGKWTKRELVLKPYVLPQKAKDYLIKREAPETVTKLIKSINPDGSFYFVVTTSTKEFRFSKDGDLVPVSKNENDY